VGATLDLLSFAAFAGLRGYTTAATSEGLGCFLDLVREPSTPVTLSGFVFAGGPGILHWRGLARWIPRQHTFLTRCCRQRRAW